MKAPRRIDRGATATGVALLLLGVALLLPWVVGDTAKEKPRVLVLALDGVPYRAAVDAVEEGAFEGWPLPKAMVAPFPSMTNVSFTAMLMPLGVQRITGYEVRHFNPEENKVVSGLVNYEESHFKWRDRFQITLRKKRTKISNYLKPRPTAWKMMGWVEQMVLESEDEVMLAHIGSADVIGHYFSGDALTPFMVEISDRVNDLMLRHREIRGRELRVILLSDHGNTTGKVLHTSGMLDNLRDAGFRVSNKLELPNDVVVPTYGVVNFGVLYTRQDKAEKAARAFAGHESVDLAAWVSGAEEITVIGHGEEALVRWRGKGEARRFAYEPVIGDPLGLAVTNDHLQWLDLLDEEGYAAAQDWFDLTAFADYPDALRRVVDSITGTYVDPPATAIFSLDPGWAMGLWSAQVGVRVVTGRLQGTHGGLDRDSTLGFFLSNNPEQPPGLALTAEQALLELKPYAPLPRVWPPPDKK